MKKRTLLAMILSLVMCLGLAMPAWAAEEVTDTLDVMEIMNSVEFEAMEIQSIEQVDESAGVQKFTVDTANDTIDVYADNVNVSKQMIEEYLNRAAYAIAQENAVALYNNEEADSVGITQYIYMDGENQITYVEGEDDNRELIKGMLIESADIVNNNSETADIALAASDKTDIPGGLGIKVFANETGQFISGKFANCPPLNRDKLQNDQCAFYHYFGFTTNSLPDTNSNYAHSDIGVIYSGYYNGWYPYMLLQQDKKTYMVDNEENKPSVTAVGFQLRQLINAGYGMTSPVSMTVYKNTTAYNGSGTVVRLVTFGKSNTTKEDNLKCIVDAGRGVSNSVEYRVLTTIAGKNIIPGSNSLAPRIETNYYDVKIDGVTATWQTDKGEIGARITKCEPGILQGKVNFS